MNLSGTTVLITGATSGIGQALAHRLAAQVGTLLVHGPQPETELAWYLAHLRDQGTARVEYLQADFTSLADVHALATRVRDLVDHLDLLVNNAAATPSPRRVLTADGHERAWQVNYLATAALTADLADHVTGRIVNIASDTHRSARLDFNDLQLDRDYSPFEAYRRSKLAIVTFTQWLAHRLPAAGPSVVAVCPGPTSTPLLDAMFPGMVGQPVEQAVAHVVAGATDELPTGTYTHDGRVATPNATATDPAMQAQLVAATSAALGMPLEELLPTSRA